MSSRVTIYRPQVQRITVATRGPQGPGSVTPSGTGLRSVTGGVEDTPSTLADRVESEAANLRDKLGLGAVDNTADAGKPVSTAQAAADAAVASTAASALSNHANATTGAHGGIVASSDPRLTDSRTPTAHASSHGSGGADPLTLTTADVANMTAAGVAIATAATVAAQRTALGLGGAALLEVGTTAGTVAAGNLSTTALNIYRESTYVLQLGVDAATPVNETIKAPDGVGTDKIGANLTIEGGKSTGSGKPGSLIGRTCRVGTTGSSANLQGVRYYYSGKPITLTESSATTLFSVSIADGDYFGATVVCTVFAATGSDYQAIHTTVQIAAVNYSSINFAGSVTATSSGTAATAGTLSATFTLVDAGGGTLQLKCNAVSSLTQTTFTCKWAVIGCNTDYAQITPA
jgi:hypothetical protein